MTIYTQVNTGAADDDGTGDTVRAAFEKVNANLALQDVAITLDEVASASAPGDAKGKIWVKNDTPNVLMFTDDAGTETELGAGGGGGTPGGADTQLQYNDGGAFGGDAMLSWTNTSFVPQLEIGDGTSTSIAPTILMNCAAAGSATIDFEQGGAPRARIEFLDSAGGYQNSIRLTSITGPISFAPNNTVIANVELGTGIEILNGGLMLTERADHPAAPAAIKGQIWLRNDANQTLMFTDDAAADFVIGGAAATKEKSLNQPGELITIISTLRWYPTRDITLINITANVGVAATAANIVLDVKKNDISILASNITILATEFTAAPVVPTDTTLLTTDYLTVDILQIGLSLPGEDLVVNFKYQ